MSNFTLPSNQTLPSTTSDWGSQELVVGNWLTYWQTYFLTFFTAANRLAGGTGFDSDNIADKAITGKHISSNIKRATQPSADTTFGSIPITIFSIPPLAVPVANADVFLNAVVRVEPLLAGDNLFNMAIERSPDNSTWTTIAEVIDSKYSSNAGVNFRWLTLSISNFIDVVPAVPTGGLWYYRVTVAHERNNTSVPATTNTANTVTINTARRTWATAEWRNQRQ